MWGRDGILLLHTQKAGLRGETLLSPILQIALITWYWAAASKNLMRVAVQTRPFIGANSGLLAVVRRFDGNKT